MKHFNFLIYMGHIFRNVYATIFRFVRHSWKSIVGFVIVNKVYIGWGLVIIVPLVGLIILFIYLANRPKEEIPEPYIQTNQPRKETVEPYSGTLLYVTHADGYAENISMVYDRMIIGKHPSCQIVLRDSNVADQHCEIYVQEGRYFVRDYGSGYGTYVNSTPITDITEIFAGYYVQMGGSTIQL
jgi:hypothetical protein